MQELFHQKIESEEAKRARMNMLWRDESKKFNVSGQELSLKDCYAKSIYESHQTFEQTREVARENILEGKYILYVNSTASSIASNENIKYIDKDRLEMFYEAETGSGEIDPDNFQANNMRHCLGIEKGDPRFRSVNLTTEEIPEDLSNCVGIVFSGSEVNVKGEDIQERIEILKKAEKIANKAIEQGIISFGICFGGQLLAKQAGAEIDWIEKNGERKSVTGINPVILENSFLFSAENHKQEIKKNTLPDGAQVIAYSVNGGIEIIRFPDKGIFSVQFHPEVDPTRLDLMASMKDTDQYRGEFFSKDLNKVRSIVFPDFLNAVGYNAKRLQN